MKISYSFGIIDLLHLGHINTLLEAKKHSDIHIFGLVSDEATIEWMGTIVSDYEERKKVLENVSCIDEIVFQKTLDPLENVKKIHDKYPKAEITLYHGDDWKIMPSEEYLKSIGGKVIFTKYYEKMKPENIIKQLNERIMNNKRPSNLISTKANTLSALKDKLYNSQIEDMLIITVGEFKCTRNDVCQSVKKRFNGRKIVIRSSSSNEDCFVKSNAGHYDSILNVDSLNDKEIVSAIETVIDSYSKDSLTGENEQILIQTQTSDVYVSGVIFTRDINQNRPYYLINYDNNGSTDSVTSGSAGKTIWISHDRKDSKIPALWVSLLKSVNEIEKLLDGMVLDIEFAIKRSGDVVIFQVRPLAANYKFRHEIKDNEFFTLKTNEKLKYNKIVNKYENTNMMLSDMAFWNPSEIIGTNPRNLDYSLYREIITKGAWNEGLVPMGYREVNKDLMYKLGNKPYISLEYSFMSLIPKNLSKELSIKLMKYYKEKLKRDLTAHDKIEFEIVISCYDFKTNDSLKDLVDHGFSLGETEEVRKALFNLTEEALLNYFKVLKQDLEDIKCMAERRKVVENKISFKQDNISDLLLYFKTLIKDLKKYGTPQFSRQARYAFIANSLCKSLVSKGYINEESMDDFMLSIETVASGFEKDFNLYLNGKISRDEFNKKYGHLRSGTYDIRTLRYDQIYFEPTGIMTNTLIDDEVAVTKKLGILDNDSVSLALSHIGFQISTDEFVKILKSSFEQREFFKFEFTKTLSLAIEILIMIGKKLDIEKKLLSYLEMSEILASEYYQSEDELREFWITTINQRKLVYKERFKLVLPEVIISENDFDFIKIGESRPNFITNKEIDGEVVLLEEENDTDITGKIVVISKADPGFDWIFAKGIKGLITKYGGVASHMAIRCAEFGIPAAIGCGEKIYNYVSNSGKLRLDCKKGKITQWS